MENKQEYLMTPFGFDENSMLVDFSNSTMSMNLMFAQAMRVLNQNWRQGTVACKGRSDVARSNRKPWKQKGTGRARAGSARSPLWKGGGVIHGPQERVARLKINKEVRKQVLHTLCSQMVFKKNILVLQGVNFENNLHTRDIKKIFTQCNIWGAKVLFFMEHSNIQLFQALRNIGFVKPIFFDQPDIAHFSSADYWIVLESDKEFFKQMVSKWR